MSNAIKRRRPKGASAGDLIAGGSFCSRSVTSETLYLYVFLYVREIDWPIKDPRVVRPDQRGAHPTKFTGKIDAAIAKRSF